ncbi:MAG: DUF1993 domain-containing protein [Pseudomonadota bacterium]
MNLYDLSVATYRSRLDTLAGLIAKAEQHREGDSLCGAKLADDMHPLGTQIRFVTNIPGEAMDRLGVTNFSSSDDEVTSFAQAKELIENAKDLLDTIDVESLPAPDQPMEFAIGGGAFEFAMTAEEYVRDFSLPNFYFHLSIAYAILRMSGLEIGKADFIPHMFRYIQQLEG